MPEDGFCLDSTHFCAPSHDSGRVLLFHVGHPCVSQSVIQLVCHTSVPSCFCVSLSYICPSMFLFPDDNLSEYQWIFTKLGMFINIVEI